MSNIVITDDKSTSGVPVLIVGRDNRSLFTISGTLDVIKTFTGEEATELYKKLTSKEDK
jgi:hypothetical protein